MTLIKANFRLTINFFATFKNKVTPRYYSAAWECESLGQNFFKQKVNREDFGWFFPPPRLFWPAYLHLKNEKAN